LYGPLTDAVRDLIDATIRTEADEDTIRAARTAIAAVTETLRAGRRPTARGALRDRRSPAGVG
jgi:hypothetical protein